MQIFLPLVIYATTLHGVGFSYSQCADLHTIQGVEWYYNWSYKTRCTIPGYVPMIYNTGQVSKLAQAQFELQQGDKWLMGFNEPDRADQGNVAPEEAAVAWRHIELAVGDDVRLVSPAASQSDPAWLWRMVVEYQRRYRCEPRFDAVAWHIYTNSPESAKRYILARHAEMLARGYDVPIWVTEYGGACWESERGEAYTGNRRMMIEFTTWMKQQSWIERYAWFASRIEGTEAWGPGWQSCSLVNPATGELTGLGKVYAD